MTPEERQQLENGIHQANLALKSGNLSAARRGLLMAVRAIEKAERIKGAKEHAHALN